MSMFLFHFRQPFYLKTEKVAVTTLNSTSDAQITHIPVKDDIVSEN